MTTRWMRVPPDRGDTAQALVAAGALAAGVGLVTFYLARLLLAREPLGEGTPADLAVSAPAGEDA